MSIFKRFRDWWNTVLPETPTSEIEETNSEPQEVWQWQINCSQKRYDGYPVPKAFGLIVGTVLDAETKLKEHVTLPHYYDTNARVFNEGFAKDLQHRMMNLDFTPSNRKRILFEVNANNANTRRYHS